VIHYYTEYYLPNKVEERPDGSHDEGLREFYEGLKKLADDSSEYEADQIQNMAFQAAKTREYKMKDWFKTLYQVFLGQSSGPKIGSFIALIGLERAIDRLSAYFDQ
jgi:lysyl-tRNA synthetase class 1